MATQQEIIKNFRVCHMKGCLAMGYWSPVISVSPDNLQRAYLPMPHMLMCDHHKAIIGLDDFINGPVFSGDNAWVRIQAAFATAGKDEPLLQYTHLIWEQA